jgi:hypothetical protein
LFDLPGLGGAVCLFGSETLFEVKGTNTKLTFIGNEASVGYGGAVSLQDGSDMHVLDGATVEYRSNRADLGGGAIYLRDVNQFDPRGFQIFTNDYVNKFVRNKTDEDINQLIEELSSDLIISGTGTTVDYDSNSACWGSNSEYI